MGRKSVGLAGCRDWELHRYRLLEDCLTLRLRRGKLWPARLSQEGPRLRKLSAFKNIIQLLREQLDLSQKILQTGDERGSLGKPKKLKNPELKCWELILFPRAEIILSKTRMRAFPKTGLRQLETSKSLLYLFSI